MTHGRPATNAMISPNPDNLTSSPAQACTVNRIDLTNPATLHDIELVRRFKSSDESAFGEIVARHRGRVFSIALNHLRNHADAEEITQDTFVRAYQSLPLFRGECSLASWLYRIVFNLSRNRCGYFSRRHRQDTYSYDAAISENNGATFKDRIAGDGPDPAREETNREFLALVKACMHQLNADQRKILTLRNHENCSYEIIAKTLKLSPGTVKSRIARARQNLRQLLAHAYGMSDAIAANSCSWFEGYRSTESQTEARA
jgi:RNA polymerase sigma-70 factor (ECF subfamily)